MTDLLVCDLDGTLLLRDRPFDSRDLALLQRLGDQGTIRAIATGRALATAMRVIPPDFPIDYLIFSSGAGVLEWHSQELLVSHTMHPDDVSRATRALMQLRLDFMIHAPIPDQHIFHYHRTGATNPDFERRLSRYAADGRALQLDTPIASASQLLAVSPSGDPDEPYLKLCAGLKGLSIIPATSPLDGQSMWIEVFAPTVSKSQAAAWIARTHNIDRRDTFAIGNDYNDWDLLRWAAHAALVRNAPAVMRAEFDPVESLSEWLG